MLWAMPMPLSGPVRVPRYALVALGLVAAFLPARTLRFPFLLDDTQILGNPDLRDLARLPSLPSRGYWEGMQEVAGGDQYRPVTMATLNLNFALAGDGNPAGFRGVNFVLHGTASALLATLAARVVGSVSGGLFAGAVHAVLPVHADTVAGIIHRGELLAAVLALGAALLHVRARDSGRATWGAAGLYTLAVLSKESAAALPLALLLLDRLATDTRRTPREWLRLYGPHLLALLACLGARFAVLGRIGLPPEDRYFREENDLVALLTMAQFAALHYARPLLLGTPLIADFSRRSFPSVGQEDPHAWAWLLAWVTLATMSFLLAWKRRSPAACGLACAIALGLPVSNVLVRTGILGAHRVLYLPAAGWCLALGALYARVFTWRLRRFLPLAATALLVLYAILFVRRGDVGRDRETFYASGLEQVPDNTLFLYNLGDALREKRRYADAEPLFRRSFELDPEFFNAGNNLVGVLLEQGRSAEALELAERLEPRTDSQRAARHNARAVIFGRRGGPGDYASALEEARRAVSLVPADPAYRVTAAQALLALGRRDEAREELLRALRIPTASRSAQDARATILQMLGNLQRGPQRP
jgi:protein O-mannosyl-transferase